MQTAPALDAVLARFDPIGIAEMDRVKLQVRMDTKYLLRDKDLPGILERLRPEYRLLTVDGTIGTRYRTLYFDTPEFKHYLAHHNGRTFRSKIRFREYIGSDLHFLEVKRKTGRGDTDKARLPVPAISERLQGEQLAFVQQASGDADPLLPVLWNNFTRLTLVHRTRAERLTLDRELTFMHNGRTHAVHGICVAELKQERSGGVSPFTELMRERGIRTSGMSKYCTGLLLAGIAPKYNTFKETLLRIQRLQAA
jgi:hypothetical protein